MLKQTEGAVTCPRLALHAHALLTFLNKSGLTNDQHRIGITEMRHHVGAQIIANVIRAPSRAAEQVLHARRHLVADLLGQLPAILARYGTEQALLEAYLQVQLWY